MEFSLDERNLESLDIENSDIQLSSSSVKCEICKTGIVVKVGRESHLVLYTRKGTKKGVHIEKRQICAPRKNHGPCQPFRGKGEG